MMNLVPLPLAARHVYLCVEDYAPNARPRERLDRLGRLMAQLGGLYVVEEESLRPLAQGERVKPDADLRVTHDCIEKAIATLRRNAARA